MSGIDITKEFNLQKHSILVTSRSDESIACNSCEKHKIKLLPKELVEYTPVNITAKNIYQSAIFFDDDQQFLKIIRKTSEDHNIPIKTRSQTKTFFDLLKTLPKHAPIFIDSNLNTIKKGKFMLKMPTNSDTKISTL